MTEQELLAEIARLEAVIRRMKDDLGLDEEDWMN
jgi:hypothetical protein